MSDTTDTVELPADPRIKQLAHDVVREENEEMVPLLLDFYTFLSKLDEEEHQSLSDLTVDEPESELAGTVWRNYLDVLVSEGIVEKHHGSTNAYTLSE
jgi:hypothetical protein